MQALKPTRDFATRPESSPAEGCSSRSSIPHSSLHSPQRGEAFCTERLPGELGANQRTVPAHSASALLAALPLELWWRGMDFLKKVKRYVLGDVRVPLFRRVPAGSQRPRHRAHVACQACSALAPTVSCVPEDCPVLTTSPIAQVGSLFHASLLVVEALAEVPGRSACAPLAAALTFACERTCARCHIALSRLQPGAESARAGTLQCACALGATYAHRHPRPERPLLALGAAPS
jgi:hypothetical protein